MTADIEYWQNDADMITVEPKTFNAKSAMVDAFPIFKKNKLYISYLAPFGSMRWDFPFDSPVIHEFLENTIFTSEKITQETNLIAC